MKKIFQFAIVAAAIAMTACTGKTAQNTNAGAEADSTVTPWYEDMDALQADLNAAIEDARVLDSTKVGVNLMPIKKGTPNEEWATIEGKDMVLLVTLVDSSRLQKFFGQEGVYQIDREMGTWVTIPGEWLSKKEAFEGLDSVAAHMRMLQMYGLSPDCTYNIMIQFYADVKGIFRPASDPSIETTSAGIEFPAWADENYKVGDTNFREWFRYNVQAAFEDDSPLPWTRLGYTYDWHKGAPRQGLSEYIVVDQTYLKVKSHESEWQFIQNLSK
ncbi:MAG: hypothetical protein J6M19_03320 [Bacteroidaceae bacterium]|nr:hypothetical protein [Bacteroidaceae bacterium]